MQLGKQQLQSKQQEYVAQVIDNYEQKTPTSKEFAQAYRPVLADKSSIGFNFSQELKEICYPIVCDRSSGSRLWDVDGNEYIDILMGLGINLLGHNPPFIREAVEAQLQKGIHIGAQVKLAGEVAALIKELTGNDRVTLSNTGTEAIMTAIRIARTATKRDKIAIFTNSYHGHNDSTLVRAGLGEYAKKAANRVIDNRLSEQSLLKKILAPLQKLFTSNINPKAVPAIVGVPANIAKNVLVLDYGNPQSLEIIKANQNQLAAVLVEPVQSRNPELQPKEFILQLRAVTEQAKIALIFDEMVTGFRIHQGGAQAWFGVKADIVTYSKIVGGGLPLSAIAGKAEYLDRIDGGMWNFGDDSAPGVQTTFFAGTFCKHPLSLAAAKATLEYLKTEGTGLQEKLNERTGDLVGRLNSYLQSEKIPIRFTRYGSFFAIALSQSKASPMALNLLSYELLNRGIHLRRGDKGGFLSTAHSEDDVDRIFEAFKESFQALRSGGFLA